MSALSLQELLEKLRIGDESVEIEAKRGSGIDHSVIETVCAFANEPGLGGGYILLGIAEEPGGLFGTDYSVVGVKDPGKLQSDLATRCRNDLQPPVRPEIRPEEFDGMTTLIVFVSESPPGDKPVHIKSEGLPAGAYRRIASSDMHCTDEDLAVLYQGRAGVPYDATAVEGTTLQDIDPDAVREYRVRRAEIRPDAGELRFGDQELLHALGATTTARNELRLTVAGLMLFGREASLRRYAPMTRVDYILVEGREWVKNPAERYAATEMRGPLLTLIPRVVQQVLADIPASFSLGPDELHRKDIPLIPRTVIREAIVNALMHRSYRTSSPVQIIRYSNRIEIRNVGYSLKPEDRLGEPGSLARNPSIAAALHEAGLAETKGSGIRTMRELMHKANLTPPFFESDRQKDEFGLMLLVHHLLSENDVAWLQQFRELELTDDEARVLVVIREAGAVSNSMYREITGLDTLAASKSLQRLRDAGLLSQRGKGRATFYVSTDRLLSEPAGDVDAGNADKGIPPSPDADNKPGGLIAKSGGLQPKPGGLSTKNEGFDRKPTDSKDLKPADLPTELAEVVRKLGKKAPPDRMRQAIQQLCAWRPLSASDLASILDRTPGHLRDTYLTAMVAASQLVYTHPTESAHPQQAYRAPDQRQ